MKEKLIATQKKTMANSYNVAGLMQQLLLRRSKIDRKCEHFWAIYLDTDNQILSVELTALGTLNQAYVAPMDVFGPALRQKCAHLIVVHNHPGNDARPSDADVDLTHKMHAIGKFFNIELLDHLIITEKDYYSFSDEGLMTKIKREGRYDLSFQNIKTWLNIHKNMKRWYLRDKRMLKVTIAQRILQKGTLDIQEIGEITGLTSRQLAKLQPALK